MSDPHFERPDLAPLRAVASQAEFAEAFRGLLSADGYPLAEGEPLTPLACDVARSLIEAGFTLHHCDRHDPLYRLGGVCLVPIPAGFGTGRSGIAVSWTTHNLLLLDWDRRGTYHRATGTSSQDISHTTGKTRGANAASWHRAGRASFTSDPED